MINPSDINLTPVVEASVRGVLEAQGALDSFDWENIDPVLKESLARNILPYLHEALPCILGQVNARIRADETFIVPDTLEGLL
jgi:hypothetical protein